MKCADVGCPGVHPLPEKTHLDHLVLAQRQGIVTTDAVLDEMEVVHERFLNEQTIDYMQRTIG